MKKLLLTTIICTLLLSFTACSSPEDILDDQTSTDGQIDMDQDDITDLTTEDDSNSDSTDDNDQEPSTGGTLDPSTDDTSASSDVSLESLIDTIYAATDIEFPNLMKSPLTKENQAYMLGVDNFDFIEGIASEPMMSSQAHSVVLLTVKEDSDIEAIKEDIKANVDGYKWICVGVEPENIIVDSKDNMIILIMDEHATAIHDAFLKTVN